MCAQLTEENETLVAKLVRAVREKELAQEALAKVRTGRGAVLCAYLRGREV